jgi:hypothetical protein
LGALDTILTLTCRPSRQATAEVQKLNDAASQHYSIDVETQSMPSECEFDFDRMLGNTVVYRRAFMAPVIKRSNSNLAFRDTDAKPMEELYSALPVIEEDDDLC